MHIVKALKSVERHEWTAAILIYFWTCMKMRGMHDVAAKNVCNKQRLARH